MSDDCTNFETEEWLRIPTATPGEVRVLRKGSGYPTLCFRNDELTILPGHEQTVTLPRDLLEAGFNAAKPPLDPPPPSWDLVVKLREALATIESESSDRRIIAIAHKALDTQP